MQKESEIIRAIWLNQPYASLMLHGKIETRTYPTKVRGKVLICSTLSGYSLAQVREIAGDQAKIIEDLMMDEYWKGNPNIYGHAIAIGNLVGCRLMTPEDEAKCFVAYREPWTVKTKKDFPYDLAKKQLWCWVFSDVRAIEPFPLKGKQGWAILTDEQKAMIKVKPISLTASDEFKGFM